MDLNLNFALVLVVGLDGPVMVVTGGVVSTVHVLDFAGDLSIFPARSVARTWNVCFPSTKGADVHGLVQNPNTPPSRLHPKVLPSSVEVKEIVAIGFLVKIGGLEVMIVFGIVLSIVQSKLAGVGSAIPFAIARTLKL